MPEVKIGQSVDIVVEQGLIRLSSVQDILENRIVLLQIVPPLSESYIGKTILVTYLTPENRYVRRSFKAKFMDIREGYVTVGRGFPAIIVEPVSSSEVCDLRIHKRHPPQPSMKIMLGADYLEIMDISISGAHLVRPAGKGPILKVDDAVLLTVHNGPDKNIRRARIIRQWHSRGTNGPEHLAVIFL
ncbi:MAG: hypothetical protein ABFD50_20350 [Smithella sp.]